MENDHIAVLFRIDTRSALHRLYVDEKVFLSDNSPSRITDFLKGWEVADELRRSGNKALLVGSEGLHLIVE